MEVTFLCAIDVQDLTDLTGIALDIQSDLERGGHLVLSVKPWARPSDPVNQPAGGFMPLPDLGIPPNE